MNLGLREPRSPQTRDLASCVEPWSLVVIGLRWSNAGRTFHGYLYRTPTGSARLVGMTMLSVSGLWPCSLRNLRMVMETRIDSGSRACASFGFMPQKHIKKKSFIQLVLPLFDKGNSTHGAESAIGCWWDNVSWDP